MPGHLDTCGDVGEPQAYKMAQSNLKRLAFSGPFQRRHFLQLLGSVWGPLERLQKEGETGRKKINEYTRYATVFLCIGQSWALLSWLVKSNYVLEKFAPGGSLTLGLHISLAELTPAGGVPFVIYSEDVTHTFMCPPT